MPAVRSITGKSLLGLVLCACISTYGAITELSGPKRWILSTERSAYLISVTPEDRVINDWWGPQLAKGDYTVSAWHPKPFSEGPARQEYAPWGGMYYAEPSVKVRFVDGNRDLQLRFKTAQVSSNHLAIQMTDEHYPFDVSLHYNILEQLDLIERWAEIRNRCQDAVQIEVAASALWSFPPRQHWRMRYLAGRYGAETQVHDIDLGQGKFQIESRRGASSHQFSPFFAVSEAGTVSEESGSAWFGELAWSGSWKIGAEINSIGKLQVYGGIHDFDFEWKLDPGESFVTPNFVGGFSDEGYGGASRRLARYQREEILPRTHAEEMRPVIFNSCYATELNVNFQQQTGLAARPAELGAELFVVDDGWFSGRTNDFAGLGDWTPDTNKFPGGLKPLIEAVRQRGMKFGLWVEPEMVNRRSKLFKEHPDWVFAFPHRAGSEQRNQLMLNFSKPEVVEHMFGVLDGLLRDNDIAFLKWDMNRHVSEPGWLEAPPEQQKEIWVRHVRGVYGLIDRLRSKHPDVLWENCSGGGGRADLGMLSRTDQVWVSDNTDPLDRLRIQFGYTHAFAPKTMVNWVTDNPDGTSKSTIPLSFRFHVAEMGVLGLGGNILNWSEEEMCAAKTQVAQYKSFRHLIQNGELFRIGSPEEKACGFNYVDRQKNNAVALLFRPFSNFGETREFRIPGLAPDKTYRVILEADAKNPKSRVLGILSGRALLQEGIGPGLNGQFLSAVIKISSVE